MARAPLTPKRLLGLDRSGPPPASTLAGEPLRPWTIPNAIGFARIALIPVFLVVALGSSDGRSTTAAVIYAVIAGTDYLDGITARLTGQYSRLGTLLDPLTDRLLVISGAIVAYRFSLLPRWALIVLALRELLMLVLSRLALRAGLELRVRMLGRWAVWPTMLSIFLAMLVQSWFVTALFYVGLAMTLGATVGYVRDGVRAMRDAQPPQPADAPPSSNG